MNYMTQWERLKLFFHEFVYMYGWFAIIITIYAFLFGNIKIG